jgi:hypothetical protein
MISTTTSVSPSANPSNLGSSVNFVATVTGSSSGPTLTGTVTLFAGNIRIGANSITGPGAKEKMSGTNGTSVGLQ